MLPLQIRFIVFSDIMLQKRKRNNERDMTVVIIIDNLCQFQLFVRMKLFLEISSHVMQHIRILSDRRDQH